MVEFLTLFLGIVAGVRSVELAPGPGVALVELYLDGSEIASSDQPPWRFEVDFGIEPAPHELVAIARDGSGEEMGRARQRINVPRKPAEARLGLFGGAEGAPEFATLAWDAIHDQEPAQVLVRFDGEVLAAADLSRIELPPYEPQAIHVLSAELEFRDGLLAMATAVFGGEFGSRVSTELTAVPLVYEGRRGPRAGDLVNRLFADGAELTPVAVERGGADVVIVRDAQSSLGIQDLLHPSHLPHGRAGQTPTSDLQQILNLGERDRVRLLWAQDAVSSEVGERAADALFAMSPTLSAAENGLAWLLFRDRPPVPERIAEAVGAAAVLAASGERARAVVALVDPSTPDRSFYHPTAIRRFLQRINVPLHVWTTAESPELLAETWGEARSVRTRKTLRLAVERLRSDLRRQAVVWLEGTHLPDRIELRDDPAGPRIAGRGQAGSVSQARSVRVAAPGRGEPANLVFVLDPQAQRHLQEEFEATFKRLGRKRVDRVRPEQLPLPRDAKVRLIWTTTSRAVGAHRTAYEVFPHSRAFTSDAGGLAWLLLRYGPPSLPERVADAVKVAGTLAAAPNRPRAVVLIVDSRTVDGSLINAATARDSLARVGVSLQVWVTGPEPAAVAREWGQVEALSDWTDLERAVAQLRSAG